MKTLMELQGLAEAYAKAYAEKDIPTGALYRGITHDNYVKAQKELFAALSNTVQYQQAFTEWADKTAWVQKSHWAARYLGQHLADAMRQHIEALETQPNGAAELDMEALTRLTEFVKANLQGKCRVLSQGAACTCALCDLERLVDSVHSIKSKLYAPAAEEAVNVLLNLGYHYINIPEGLRWVEKTPIDLGEVTGVKA